jgi:hypothetical protein
LFHEAQSLLKNIYIRSALEEILCGNKNYCIPFPRMDANRSKYLSRVSGLPMMAGESKRAAICRPSFETPKG